MSSVTRMDMERRREEAKRMRASQAQLASKSQNEDIPKEPLFDAPRKIDQSDGSSRRIKEILGKWNEITWISGMPVKASPKVNPSTTLSGQETGSPAPGPQSTDHTSSAHPPRINGQHKHQTHVRSEPQGYSQDRRRESSSERSSNPSTGTRCQYDRSKDDEKHREGRLTSHDHASPTFSRQHPGSGGTSGSQVHSHHGKHNQTRDGSHLAASHGSSLSLSPKSKHFGSIPQSHSKPRNSSPMLSSQDRNEASSQSAPQVSSKVSSVAQSVTAASEGLHQPHSAHASSVRSTLPDFLQSDSKRSTNRYQSSTPIPSVHTPHSPLQRTPPTVTRTSPVRPVGLGDNNSRSPSGQVKPKQLTLQIKQEQPVEFKDLDNIFEEMAIRPPHTAIQTPVKAGFSRFPFASNRDEESEHKSKPVMSPEKDVDVIKCKEEPIPFQKESSSLLEDDLAVSDSEDNNEVEEKPESEAAPRMSHPSKKRGGSPRSSSNESSSESESSSEDSSDSDSSSSADEKEEEEEEGQREEADHKEKEVPVQDKKDDSGENSQSVWNLRNFLVARQSPPVSSLGGAQPAADPVHKLVSENDLADVKVSPRKMVDIGHCNSMPFVPHDDLDTMLRSNEKAGLSPDAPSTASSTASSQQAGKPGTGKSQPSLDSQQAASQPKVSTVPQDSTKSGPGRPKSVSGERSVGGTTTKRKGSSKEEASSVAASGRKRKRKDSGSSAKVTKESRPPLVRTSSSSDVDIESVTPDPKSNQAASVLIKTEKLQEGFDSVSKQLFTSPIHSPQPHPGLAADDKPVHLSRSKTHQRKDHISTSERTHKRETSASDSSVKPPYRKLSGETSSSGIESIMAEMKKEFKLPAMLSPTEPHRSPSTHDKDCKMTEVDVAPPVSSHVPTSTCGRPSIVVRILPSKLRNGLPSSRRVNRTTGSKRETGSPSLSVFSHSISTSVEKGAVASGLELDSSSVPVACNKSFVDQTEPLSPLPSDPSSPGRVTVPKHRKQLEHSDTVKKQKAGGQQASKVSGKSAVEILQNGACHTDAKKVPKRPSERRSSGGSNRSTATKKPKQDAQPVKAKPAEEPQQNGVDAALPFDSYSIDHSPSHPPASTPTGSSSSSTRAVPDPLLPTEDRLETPEFYLSRAKELKHIADKAEKPAKLVPYIKSILYFVMWGYSMEKQNHNEPSRVFSLYADTCQLLQYVSRFRNLNAASSNQDYDLIERDKKLSVLILRMQSLLNLKMFNLKKTEAMKFKKIIEHEYKSPSLKVSAHAPSPHQNSWNKSSTGVPSPMSPTPSPTCSIGSVGSQGSCEQTSSKPSNGSASAMSSPGAVTVPQRIHSVTQKYMAVTAHLVQAHDMWEQSEAEAYANREFFGNLDNRCGPLSLHSRMLHLVQYVNLALKEIGCS